MSLREQILDKLEDPEAVVRACKEYHVPADIFIFSEHLPNLSLKYHYHMEWGNIAALPISTYEEWYSKQIHRNTRNKIKKSTKCGVHVTVRNFDKDLASGISGIFNETPVRRGRKYPYFGKTIEEIEQEWSSDLERSVFLVASFKGEVVGFIKLVYCLDCARTSGTVAKISHRDKAVMNALFARAVEFCADRKIEYLVYGRFTYGQEHESGLSEFKSHSGFLKISIPEYYVPLTIWGKIALMLHLHHGLAHLLPNRAVRVLKRIRTLYYQRMLHKLGRS